MGFYVIPSTKILRIELLSMREVFIKHEKYFRTCFTNSENCTGIDIYSNTKNQTAHTNASLDFLVIFILFFTIKFMFDILSLWILQ